MLCARDKTGTALRCKPTLDAALGTVIAAFTGSQSRCGFVTLPEGNINKIKQRAIPFSSSLNSGSVLGTFPISWASSYFSFSEMVTICTYLFTCWGVLKIFSVLADYKHRLQKHSWTGFYMNIGFYSSEISTQELCDCKATLDFVRTCKLFAKYRA